MLGALSTLYYIDDDNGDDDDDDDNLASFQPKCGYLFSGFSRRSPLRRSDWLKLM